MSGSSTTQTGSSQSVNQIPQWMTNAGMQNYAFAQDVASQPLQQYQGQMVADVSPQTQQAWNLAASSANAGKDQFNSATSGYLNALGQTPTSVTNPGDADMINAGQLSSTDLQPYMNPFTQNVINTTLPIYQQNLGLQQAGNQNAANAANAFGGSRMGVQQGVTQAQGAQGMAQMAEQLNAANFAQAQAAGQFDVGQLNQIATTNQAAQQANLNRNLQAQTTNQAAQQAKINSDILASQGLTNTGTAMNQANVANYGMLTSAGAGQSMQAQNEINSQISKFNEARNYPNSQLNTLLAALGMTPHDTASTSTSQQTTQTSPNWGEIVTGGLSDAVDVMKMFGMGSDRSMKTDITKLGKDPATGLQMHAFRYKGDPKTYPKVVGPMAQDIAKVAPQGVRPLGGKLTVAPSLMAAVTPPRSGGTGSFLPSKASANKAISSPRAGAKALHGLSNTKLRQPAIMGALSG